MPTNGTQPGHNHSNHALTRPRTFRNDRGPRNSPFDDPVEAVGAGVGDLFGECAEDGRRTGILIGRRPGENLPEKATKYGAAARLTLPYHNGGTEGVNTKTKRIMRQMHGRVGFPLLRHRILLG